MHTHTREHVHIKAQTVACKCWNKEDTLLCMFKVQLAAQTHRACAHKGTHAHTHTHTHWGCVFIDTWRGTQADMNTHTHTLRLAAVSSGIHSSVAASSCVLCLIFRHFFLRFFFFQRQHLFFTAKHLCSYCLWLRIKGQTRCSSQNSQNQILLGTLSLFFPLTLSVWCVLSTWSCVQMLHTIYKFRNANFVKGTSMSPTLT